MSENPIKKLRDSLAWNQATLAQAIGRSWQSVQNYEAGKRVPAEVLEKLKGIAAENGLADIALELSSDEWQVQRVFKPGETIISQARSHSSDDLQRAHQMLEMIYRSGNPEAIAALHQNLVILTDYVQLVSSRTALHRKKPERRGESLKS